MSRSKGHNNEIAKMNRTKFKNLLKNHLSNFNQTYHKPPLSEDGSSVFKCLVLRGDDNKIAKMHSTKLKNLLHIANGPILTKLGTKHL